MPLSLGTIISVDAKPFTIWLSKVPALMITKWQVSQSAERNERFDQKEVSLLRAHATQAWGLSSSLASIHRVGGAGIQRNISLSLPEGKNYGFPICRSQFSRESEMSLP